MTSRIRQACRRSSAGEATNTRFSSGSNVESSRYRICLREGRGLGYSKWPLARSKQGIILESLCFSLFEFIGVALVSKIIYVSGIQFCSTSSVYCVHHPKLSLLPTSLTLLYPLLSPPPPFHPVITILLSVPMSVLSLIPSPFSLSSPPPNLLPL